MKFKNILSAITLASALLEPISLHAQTDTTRKDAQSAAAAAAAALVNAPQTQVVPPKPLGSNAKYRRKDVHRATGAPVCR